jgi:hypothetical protein
MRNYISCQDAKFTLNILMMFEDEMEENIGIITLVLQAELRS